MAEVKTPAGHAAVAAVADADRASDVTPITRSAALDWFLDPEPEDVASNDVEVNVGGPIDSGTEKWITFKVQVLDREEIRQIRKSAEYTVRDEKEIDETEANLQIAVEGLLDPNLKDPANLKVRGQSYPSPAEALRARFAHKPGLIDQIASKIIAYSGYDDADVREVKAAKN